jgi:hypothetical protein
MMTKILNLINYDLKKIDINLKFSENCFLSNNSFLDDEIFYSVTSYYSFINNTNSIESFKVLHTEIEKAFKDENNGFLGVDNMLKKNNIFMLSLWFFYNKNIDLFITFHTVLIFKALSSKSLSNKLTDYEINDYENSDIVISKAVELYEKFTIFYEIDTDIDNYSREIRSYFFSIFEFLSMQNNISSKVVWVKKFNESIKSIKYWKLKNFENFFDLEESFKIYYKEPRIITYKKKMFILGGYYNKTCEIFRKNPLSDLRFEFKNLSYLYNLSNMKWYVDMDWFEQLIKIVNIPDGSILEQNILKNIEKLKNCQWRDIECQKKVAEDFYFLKILKFYCSMKEKKIKNPIYFSFFFDFRGRMYFDSSISVTSCKYLRTVYYYGEYEPDEYTKSISKDYYEVINMFEHEILTVSNFFKLEFITPKIKINLLFVIISIGKVFIDKKEYKTHMSEFVKQGVNCIINNIKADKIEDEIEIQSYIHFLKKLDNKKRIVIKDFTASFFQHLTRLLGASKQITLELSNMYDPYTWYDPYTFLLNDFLNNNKIENFSLFTRKSVKKVIMTIPYSIGWKSAWKYFLENIDENKHKNCLLKKEFLIFFNYIKNKLDGDFFFKNPTERILLYAIATVFHKKNLKINVKNGCAHLIYYKAGHKKIDLIVKINKKNIRITKNINSIDKNTPDFESMIISVRANWIALMDGECLRSINILSGRTFFSIHDSILTDWLSIDSLLNITNTILSDINFENITWDNKSSFHPQKSYFNII